MGVFGAIIGGILSLILYGFLLVRVLPKMFYSKWFYILVGIVYVLMTGFFVLVYFFDKEPFFVATPLQNNLIILGCMIIFISWWIYLKSWLTIVLPFLLSLGPIAERFIPKDINKDPFYLILTFIFCILGLIILFNFMFKSKKNKSSF